MSVCGLTEIGVGGVQQACQAWRVWSGVTRSSILTLVYDGCISVFELRNVYIMFVDMLIPSPIGVLQSKNLTVGVLIIGIFPSRLCQPRFCHSQISYRH
jgi:hypothetical protein